MNADTLKKMLKSHKLWLQGDSKGECIDLQDADLRNADLWGTDLRRANLQDADLRDADLLGANLVGANLRNADLWGTDLRRANLQDADLRDADLAGANLWYAKLQGAKLQGTDLDFACWPLWCGSLNVNIDIKIARQLAYHTLSAMNNSQRKKFIADPIGFANKFHRIPEVPKLKGK